MPVWHEAAKKWVADGRLVMLGVIQEQHADRCRLFAQWQRFGWPILHDPINLLELQAVPIVVAIDEHGIVRAVRPDVETFEADFLNRTFADDASQPDPPALTPLGEDPGDPTRIDAVREQASNQSTANAWRSLGDALAIWAGADGHDEALAAYERALALGPDDGNTLFRLGVIYRMRFDSPGRRAGDFQLAVDYWGRALATDPNQYIWRRRIQQYGPRLDKPYPFYDWVREAAAEVRARGEQPIALAVEPTGAEIAHPSKEFGASAGAAVSPDPQGRIHRDQGGLIRVEVAVVPAEVRGGETARVHVTFFPNPDVKAHWNNESEPLRLWIDPPEGWRVSDRLLAAPQGDRPETNEIRRLDFEVEAPSGGHGVARAAAYALYYVCEDVGGTCLFLRQDIEIAVPIGAE